MGGSREGERRFGKGLLEKSKPLVEGEWTEDRKGRKGIF